MAAIGDIKTDIINFYNEAVRGKLGSDATDLDISIQLVLNNLSKTLDALTETDTSQTLEVDDKFLVYPTTFRFKSLVSIVLINNSSVRQAPLRPLDGGHQEYRDLRYLSASNGLPIQYSEFDNKFWLWYPADGDYTSEIEYYFHHPTGQLDNILFDDIFVDCIKFGTVFYKQAMKGNPKYISIWKAMYDNEKEECRLLLPSEPQISGDY